MLPFLAHKEGKGLFNRDHFFAPNGNHVVILFVGVCMIEQTDPCVHLHCYRNTILTVMKAQINEMIEVCATF